MNLRQLEAFVEVAEAGSFSKAAKILFLTQPTISAHISTLEKELNTRLFVRNTKEVSLSDSGKLLYRYARQIVDLESKIQEVFLEEKPSNVKCINIAASTVPAQYLLPEIMRRFSEKYPNEQFKIMATDSAGVVNKVLTHEADVGFTGTVLEKKHCTYIPFYRDELVIIMPNTEKYRQIVETEHSLEWIEKEAFLMREEGSGTRNEAEKLLKSAGISADRLNIMASIESSEMIKRSVKSGLGISIISRLAVKEELMNGSLLAVPISVDYSGRDLYLVYNKNIQLAPAVERFVKEVKRLHAI